MSKGIHKFLPPKPWTATEGRTVLVFRHSTLVLALGLLWIWRKRCLFIELWCTPQAVGSLIKIRHNCLTHGGKSGGMLIIQWHVAHFKSINRIIAISFTSMEDELRLGFYGEISVHVHVTTQPEPGRIKEG